MRPSPSCTKPEDPNAKALWEGVVITNDLGYVPEGTVNFLVPPTTK